jgi:hypothetical protein
MSQVHARELLYLLELLSFIVVCFGAGFLLLASKRPKDIPYKMWGWVFYLAAYVFLGMMVILVVDFSNGG